MFSIVLNLFFPFFFSVSLFSSRFFRSLFLCDKETFFKQKCTILEKRSKQIDWEYVNRSKNCTRFASHIRASMLWSSCGKLFFFYYFYSFNNYVCIVIILKSILCSTLSILYALTYYPDETLNKNKKNCLVFLNLNNLGSIAYRQ